MRSVHFAHMSIGAMLPAGAVAAPDPISRDWAWGGASGRGVRVCVVDSGVDGAHPAVGGLAASFAVRQTQNGAWTVVPDRDGDLAGHGTACAGIIRATAPGCLITSVRILSRNLRGSGEALLAAVQWAVEQRFDLVNASLSTRQEAFKALLHDVADAAYFSGTTIVCAAHNGSVASYPWRFPSVISVGSHEAADPEYLESNPDPPVDFFARGARVAVAWPGGGAKTVSGNSFAAPHVTGLAARILERHPLFRAPQLKHVLTAVSDNRRQSGEGTVTAP